MNTSGFNCFISSVLLTLCAAKENVSPSPSLQSAAPSSVPIPVMKNFTDLSQIFQNVHLYQANTEAPEGRTTTTNKPDTSPDLMYSKLSSLSHETLQPSQLPQSSNSDTDEDSKEDNSINDNINRDNKLSKDNQESPKVRNIVKVEPSTSPVLTVSEQWVTPYEDTDFEAFLEENESSDIRGDNTQSDFNSNAKLGMEPWKIGLIFAAAFIAIETMVLVIYCFVCRKRRRAILAKNREQDSEAGDTINVESNDNTLTGQEGTINGGPGQHAMACTYQYEQQEDEQRRGDLSDVTMDKRSTDV
ncbi:uncharacterized protein LOC128649350 isoform X2 [Bombina bombina]|uniref:uncharacterized protein LOC128649350 isoform X2 n=1 Tax=Bombina bombina TaxID=8345 RepID=UPI00235A49D1|nr:uncharacterized protein LOC128649350 isoform X2 [Bombina bombina]